MAESTVTSKGQVTIPKVARDALAQADTTALQISRCAEIAMGDDIYGRPEQAAQDLSANNR